MLAEYQEPEGREKWVPQPVPQHNNQMHMYFLQHG